MSVWVTWILLAPTLANISIIRCASLTAVTGLPFHGRLGFSLPIMKGVRRR